MAIRSSSRVVRPGAKAARRVARLVWACLAAAALVAIAVALPGTPADAESGESGWSKPDLLFESDAEFRDPVVVADRLGGVHAFWLLHGFGEDSPDFGAQIVYYARWDGKSWTRPTDIVASSSSFPVGAAVDNRDNLHLLWFGGRQLYYTRSTITSGSNTHNWTKPVVVDQTMTHGQVAADASGRLHRAYAGPDIAGPYYQLSQNGGDTWSFATNVSPTSTPKSSADWVRLAVGDDGTIHVVWTEFQLPQGWPPLGVYYSRSTNGGRTWSPAMEMAGQGYDQITVVTGRGGVVHTAWNGMAGVGGRYHRWSSDSGVTWSETDTVMPDGFTEGPPQLAIDSAGTVHLLTTYGNRVWYSSWRGKGWSAPVYVPSGDEADVPPLGKLVDARTVRHLEQVAMTISGGNQLHVVFWDRRPQLAHEFLWHTTKQTGSPSVAPAAAAPTQAPSPTAQPVRTPRPGPSPTLIPRPAASQSEPMGLETAPGPQSPVLAGIWPAALLVGGLLLVKAVRHRNA